MFAIVDIETTGGYAANNDITEVAIVLYDGQNITDRYETLIQPRQAIPRHIQALTGITPALVAGAPHFEAVAGRIASLLKGRIFVAHNVNFDYSFLKHHLHEAGEELDSPRICTVRLTRKVFPGLASYSLGNLCRHFGIANAQRHRAGGDATATTQLLELLLQNNAQPHIDAFVKKRAKEQSLPPHLPPEAVEQLPYSAGVYYFHDQKGRVVYVGKAKNLKYRVRSHFTHNGTGRQRQDFLRNVCQVTYQECGTELMAFILENIEIRRLWPAFNQSQKKFTATYGLYVFQDQAGYQRIAIEKQKKQLRPLYTFNLLEEGKRMLQLLIKAHQLCPRLCFLETGAGSCEAHEKGQCGGACVQLEPAIAYNERVEAAITALEEALPSFVVLDAGLAAREQSCILVEKGRFFGMGYLPAGTALPDLETLKQQLVPYPENDYIRGLIYTYVEKSPGKRIVLQAAS